jgi:hypothetical protein
MTKEKNLS